MQTDVSTGSYVHVSLDNEIRRAIVATIDGEYVDVILLKGYGNSVEPETVDETEIPPIHVSQVRLLVCPIDLKLVSSVDHLREIAKVDFSSQDWRGAIATYKEILFRLDSISHPDPYVLVRTNGAIHVATPRGHTWIDYGPVIPSSASQWIPNAELDERFGPLSDSAIFKILMPLDVHTRTLLTLGRSLLNGGFVEDAVVALTYATYLSCLMGDAELRSKAFFWRCKSRLKLGKLESAMRDANSALFLATDVLRPECQRLIHTVTRELEEQQNGTRRITRALMEICEEQIRLGNLDFRI